MSTTKPVVTRFAPSPTGYLHIGGARTALFNWLFARHHGGRYVLRIEDTDRARSTQAAIDAILDGLTWLGLDWDGPVTYQFARAARHAEVAWQLLEAGHAYKCFATPDELEAMRAAQKEAGQPQRYDGRWRDRDPGAAQAGAPFVIRLKAPQTGSTTIADLVQGPVTVANAQLDDMVLLRADGTPTYMLAVVVDDHDMGVTHVIRGDDHLTNAFRQSQLYRLAGWEVPDFAHIPLIHGPDGAKLSKRHGALGVEAYRDLGYLPEALRNYLLRLGWSHGDEEIIATEQAIAWFGLDHVGRSPSRMDFTKLANLNGHYIRSAPSDRLAELVLARSPSADPDAPRRLRQGMDGLKARAKTLVELTEAAQIYLRPRPLTYDDKAQKLLGGAALARLASFAEILEQLPGDSAAEIEGAARHFAETSGLKLGDIAQPLRAAVTGSAVSPPIFEVMAIFGKTEARERVLESVARFGTN